MAVIALAYYITSADILALTRSHLMYLCTVFNWRDTLGLWTAARDQMTERIGVHVPKHVKYAYERTVKVNKTLWSEIALSSHCPSISPVSSGTVKQEMRTGTITSCWLSDISHASSIPSVMAVSLQFPWGVQGGIAREEDSCRHHHACVSKNSKGLWCNTQAGLTQ